MANHKSEVFDYEPVTNPRGRRSSFEQPVEPAIASKDEPKDEPKTSAIKSEHQFIKRGHAVSFVGLLLFTAFVYFRPYEFSPSLEFLTSGAKWIAILTLLFFIPSQLSLEGNLTSRPREVNLLLLLTLMAFLSLATAISLSEAWDNVTEYLKVVAMFIVMINVVRTERRLRWMLWIALAVSLMTSIAAISDYQAGRLLIGGERIKGAIGGLFENPNDLALHLVTIVPLAFCLMFVKKGITRKIFYLTAAILMVAAIICTFSRGGFLGLMAVALVIAWKLGRKSRVTVIIVSLIVIAGVVAFAPAEYGGRLSSIWGGDAMGSSNARKELFWRSVIVALRYPFLGVGMGNFHFRSIHEQVSHNAFTQVASELGMAALVFYVLFMITPLRRLKRIENETIEVPDKIRFYYLSVGLQASLIGYMVASFFASVAFLWYVYYLVGYALCTSRLYADELAKDQLPVAESTSQWLPPELPGVGAL